MSAISGFFVGSCRCVVVVSVGCGCGCGPAAELAGPVGGARRCIWCWCYCQWTENGRAWLVGGTLDRKSVDQ